jgi:non-ribosomal peptide synthetase component E (peptide arylation enzyme)
VIEVGNDLEFNLAMTALLERAINRITDLPSKRQNAIARLVLAEIDAETRWDESFKTSQDELSTLAAAALAERRRGKTRKMDPVHDF